MLPMSVAQIAEVVQGDLCRVPDPGTVVAGPAIIDSRQATPGSLFIAFAGQHLDGHDFAGTAVAAGAVCVLASRPVQAPAIVVPDVQRALGQLAAWTIHGMTGITRICVTGSSGKTSTKDLLEHVLARMGPTVATHGSQNNEIGLPLTVLRASHDTRYLVLEMGARGAGHLTHLTELVPPDIALVLNVGAAHVGEFGGLEATAQAKGELVEALAPGGVAVLNADDPLVAAMAVRSAAPVLLFGHATEAQFRAEAVQMDTGGRPHFELHTPDGKASVGLRLLGEHHVANALAAAAVAHTLGMTTAQIAEALSSAVARTGSRMQLHERADGVTVIDDAYNANPDSVAAALRALAAMGLGRRTVAVLGEMGELGDQSAAEHRAAGVLAGQVGTDVVVCIGGRDAAEMVAGAAQTGAVTHLVPDPAAAESLLRGLLTAGDLVLVKASLAANLQTLVQILIAEPRSVTLVADEV
ncbi:UDP-N-acetylmuramoyl-tripeptide--D-alanyl-D-alanine ligase [Streptomyces botrytidirepellens]|uniref:UDP-N-acetylmuramoyl-tripeptide--D-alanyl-D-alanine ligase n=1 Tax=Streptomyces botrytidirepellens TaxID=2486417 RepID=A0A3M8W7Y9_9ACTN|nr:UDP-N-acetylmuramoyl-tripeptide--D-alanyl-D-alanine ligase [Streptomyces botrytidirepellens]RNG26228.1 UDP-N-acetylmuramoyl-tripeptide--D-alanyl-D-alanine ligase [Streptomyces botrytidirepellens]